MEVSKSGQGQSIQPSTPKKKYIIPLLAILVVVILLLAILAALGFFSTNDANSNVWSPHEGDFMEFTSTSTLPGIQGQEVTRQTIIAVYDTIMIVNLTVVYDGHTNYQEHTIALDERIGPNVDLNNPPSDITLQKVGTDKILTKWGFRSADHYKISSIMDNGDLWVRNGVLLKGVWHSSSDSTVDYMVTTILSDTNIAGVTN